MQIVNNSRCQICGKAANVASLEPAALPPGMVCIDKPGCRDRLADSVRRQQKKLNSHSANDDA